MSNNVNAQNSHAMRNTTVQPSQLNGGNLSQMFDLQAMRIVKGRVSLNSNPLSVTSPLPTPPIPPPLPPSPPQSIPFLATTGYPNIVGIGNFILHDTQVDSVSSQESFSNTFNYILSIPLPQISNSVSGYTGPKTVITITSFNFAQTLISNYSGYSNYIIFYGLNSTTLGGSPYSPTDILQVVITALNISFQLVNNTGAIYYTVSTPKGSAYSGQVTLSTANIATQGYNYIFNNVTIFINTPPIPPPTPPTPTPRPQQFYTVINKYDDNPLTLGPSDFIIGYGVINGNRSSEPNGDPLPLTPVSINSDIGTGNSPTIQFTINPVPPIWDYESQLWIPQNPTGSTVQTITPEFVTGLVGGIGLYINSGYGNLSPVITNSCGLTSWLQMCQGNNPFTVEGEATTAGDINITLVILN